MHKTKTGRGLRAAAATALLLAAATFSGMRQTARSFPEKPAAPQASASKIASVLPRPSEERWREIPWRTNLMQARAEAQRANKPLFLWIMDGNPLGCT